jgi:hypothetical protein|tara:strand:- start:671 stop:1363 length:693 start_codon:yes stop_codon:yes gene_type:complete
LSLSGAVKKVRSAIQEAQNNAGLSHHVEIIAVTKSHPAEAVVRSFKAGLIHIGENKVQEARQKFNSPNIYSLPIVKRMIGRLQSNKVNKAVGIFDYIDTINSLSLGRKISTSAKGQSKIVKALLQINTSNEPGKSGFSDIETDEMLECCELTNISVEGLMTMGPYGGTESEIRKSFESLRLLKETLNAQLKNPPLNELSMGMSGDYRLAVEEGSTMVRLGTALLGPRATK